jgi:hypothetical protein
MLYEERKLQTVIDIYGHSNPPIKYVGVFLLLFGGTGV